MVKGWLTFGFSVEEEDNFPRAKLNADISKTRISIPLFISILYIFYQNEHSLFDFIFVFYMLITLRLLHLVYNALLNRAIGG